jgi:hypothetical protein
MGGGNLHDDLQGGGNSTLTELPSVTTSWDLHHSGHCPASLTSRKRTSAYSEPFDVMQPQLPCAKANAG